MNTFSLGYGVVVVHRTKLQNIQVRVQVVEARGVHLRIGNSTVTEFTQRQFINRLVSRISAELEGNKAVSSRKVVIVLPAT